jgi:glutamate dehydrogenase (NAD(P)+)
MTTASPGAFATAQAQLNEAADALGLDDGLRAVLQQPRRELRAAIPVRRDDGTVRVFPAFRVQYNDARGPCLGGVRWHANESADLARALAANMTWRAAVLGLPAGGSQGAVACDAKKLSDAEKDRLARGYVRAFARDLGPDRDVLAPDLYTAPETMAWMLDEFEAIRGASAPSVATGKPTALGGIEGQAEAMARGAIRCVRDIAAAAGLDPAGACAVQGFGNAGLHAARLHARLLGGGRLVAVTDASGGIYAAAGLDPDAVAEHKRKSGRVAGFPGARPITNEDLLEINADTIYLAAMEGVVTRQNADRIRARIVCELAGAAVTPEADRILHLRGVHAIPDLLAGGGALVAAHIEYAQGRSGLPPSAEDAARRVEDALARAAAEVLAVQRERNVPLRLAAQLLAVGRVAEAVRRRGWA